MGKEDVGGGVVEKVVGLVVPPQERATRGEGARLPADEELQPDDLLQETIFLLRRAELGLQCASFFERSYRGKYPSKRTRSDLYRCRV